MFVAHSPLVKAVHSVVPLGRPWNTFHFSLSICFTIHRVTVT